MITKKDKEKIYELYYEKLRDIAYIETEFKNKYTYKEIKQFVQSFIK